MTRISTTWILGTHHGHPYYRPEFADDYDESWRDISIDNVASIADGGATCEVKATLSEEKLAEVEADPKYIGKVTEDHEFIPASLPGAMGYWPLDENGGRAAVNRLYGNNALVNLLHSPEQWFSYDWGASGTITVTDHAGNNPDGAATATRVQFGSTGQLFLDINVPADQYTISLYVKSNNGLNHDLRLSLTNVTGGLVDSPNLTVTAAGGWQRIAFTTTPTGTATRLWIRNDGTNAADVLIWGAQLEDGDFVTPYRRQKLDFLLGPSAQSWSATGLDDTDGTHLCRAIADVAPPTLTEVTIYAVVKQTSPSGFAFNICDGVDHTQLSTTSGTTLGNDTQGGRFDGQVNNISGGLNDGEWHVTAFTADASVAEYYLDGTKMFSYASGVPSIVSNGFRLGFNGASAIGLIGKRGAIAAYSAKHTPAHIESMTGYLRGVMGSKSQTLTDLSRFICNIGDSISLAGTEFTGYFAKAMADVTPVTQWTTVNGGGWTLSNHNAVVAITDSFLLPTKTKPILFVFLGRNDIAGTSGAAFVAALKTYCLARRAQGWIIIVCTVLPSTLAGFNPERGIANTIIYGDLSFYDVLCDFGAHPIMGLDAAAADGSLYPDGTHPSTIGHTYLAALARIAIEAALALAA